MKHIAMLVLMPGVLAAIAPMPASGQVVEVHGLASRDPDTIAVPDLHFEATKEVRERYYKFFYFHKQGVSFAKAVQDIAECQTYAEIEATNVDIAPFVPYSKRPEGKVTTQRFDSNVGSTYGLTGLLIMALINDGLADRLGSENLRECMGFKNYRRYGLTSDLAGAINAGPARNVIWRNAKIASGEAPDAEAIEP